MKDAGKIFIISGCEDCMNMVRHDAPRQEIVSFAVEMLEGGFHHLRDFRVAQGAGSVTGIQQDFDFFAKEFFPIRQFGRSEGLATFCLGQKVTPVFGKFGENVLRKRVRQAEGDGIGHGVLGPMGEVGSFADCDFIQLTHRLEADAT